HTLSPTALQAAVRGGPDDSRSVPDDTVAADAGAPGRGGWADRRAVVVGGAVRRLAAVHRRTAVGRRTLVARQPQQGPRFLSARRSGRRLSADARIGRRSRLAARAGRVFLLHRPAL